MVGDGGLPVFDVTGHPRLYAWTHVTRGTRKRHFHEVLHRPVDGSAGDELAAMAGL